MIRRLAALTVVLALAGCASAPREPSAAWTQCAERTVADNLDGLVTTRGATAPIVGRMVARRCGSGGVSAEVGADAVVRITERLYRERQERMSDTATELKRLLEEHIADREEDEGSGE